MKIKNHKAFKSLTDKYKVSQQNNPINQLLPQKQQTKATMISARTIARPLSSNEKKPTMLLLSTNQLNWREAYCPTCTIAKEELRRH